MAVVAERDRRLPHVNSAGSDGSDGAWSAGSCRNVVALARVESGHNEPVRVDLRSRASHGHRGGRVKLTALPQVTAGKREPEAVKAQKAAKMIISGGADEGSIDSVGGFLFGRSAAGFSELCQKLGKAGNAGLKARKTREAFAKLETLVKQFNVATEELPSDSARIAAQEALYEVLVGIFYATGGIDLINPSDGPSREDLPLNHLHCYFFQKRQARDFKRETGVFYKFVPSSERDWKNQYDFYKEWQLSCDNEHKHVMSCCSGARPMAIVDPEGQVTALVLGFPEAEGGDLERKAAKLTREERCRYIRQVVSGVAYLHGRGVRHGDLRPANVVIAGGVAKVCDFGQATVVARKDQCYHFHLQDCHGTLGTPEGCDSEKAPSDLETDMWDLGMLIYELFAKDLELPQLYKRQSSAAITEWHATDWSFDGVDGFEGVDRDLADVMVRLLELDPRKRATCNELLEMPFFKA